MSLRDQARYLEVTAKLEGRVDQFHQLGEHDQKTHGGEGGVHDHGHNKDGSDKTPEQIKSEKRKALIKKIAIGAAVVGVAAGLAFLGYKHAPGTVSWGAKAKHGREMEDIMDEGGERKDKAIKDRIDRLRKNSKDERAAKDLDLLLNNRMSDPDDTHGFLSRLNKNKYSDGEVDALWEYAGIYRDPNKTPEYGYPEGSTTKGAFRWQRKFRNEERMSRKEMETVNNLDRAIKKNTLPRDVKLFRGVPATDAEYEKWARAKPGTVIIDKAPIFTGLTESRANPHYINDTKPTSNKYKEGRNRPVLFEINAKKGTPAVSSPYGHGLVNGKKVPLPPTVKIFGKNRKIPFAKKTSLSLPWMRHLNKEELVLRRKQPLVVTGSRIREDGVLIIQVDAGP